ncbi:MAG TPA: type III pantothenate kinase [bacterium]|jgi:type III pantothenate kinase|nr:type III pantothenate kinase [bacterium]HXC63508.1 type III pantothenate kinase [bacterium]
MLLVLDIGNSNVVAGVYHGPVLRRSWRFASTTQKTSDEYGALLEDFFKQSGLKPSQVDAAILASVVPPLVAVFEEAIRRLFKLAPMVVGPHLDLGIGIRTRQPEEVGADRLVNAVAGFQRFGGPLLILDFGTATTVDAVSASGDYLGGAIAPGVAISIEALVSRTAKLPRIEMAKPASPIGDSTLEAMRSGIYYATLGATRELCQRLGAALAKRDHKAARIIATGGLSYWLPGEELGIQAVVPDLTLEGLRLIHGRNSKPRKRRARP